jgi:hypothetical protein
MSPKFTTFQVKAAINAFLIAVMFASVLITILCGLMFWLFAGFMLKLSLMLVALGAVIFIAKFSCHAYQVELRLLKEEKSLPVISSDLRRSSTRTDIAITAELQKVQENS